MWPVKLSHVVWHLSSAFQENFWEQFESWILASDLDLGGKSTSKAKMRYVAAYALAVMGGNEFPAVEDLERIIGSVGVDFDHAQAEMVVHQLAGKDLQEVIDAGRCCICVTSQALWLPHLVLFLLMQCLL